MLDPCDLEAWLLLMLLKIEDATCPRDQWPKVVTLRTDETPFVEQACGHNEDRASMILCSHCDASYHEGCLDERSTPNEKVGFLSRGFRLYFVPSWAL